MHLFGNWFDMKRFSFFVLSFFCLSVSAQYTTKDIYDYIEAYNSLAIAQMKSHGIPASITLAQGILESAAGTSDLATKANNHFGIKCHSNWTGKTYYKDDDKKDECFRSYLTVIESFEDHSEFLKRPRYQSLFSLPITDYKSWAKGLKDCGYATNPQYANRLIKLIEDYDLAKFDTAQSFIYIADNENSVELPISTENLPKKNIEKVKPAKKEWTIKSKQTINTNNNTSTPKQQYLGFEQVDYPYTTRPVYKNNGVYFVVAHGGDTYFSIAVDVQLGLGELKIYNDIPFRKYEPCSGEFVYLQRKQSKSAVNYHILGIGETLRDVAQKYAVRLKALYRLNNLKKNTELKPGQKLRLQ